MPKPQRPFWMPDTISMINSGIVTGIALMIFGFFVDLEEFPGFGPRMIAGSILFGSSTVGAVIKENQYEPRIEDD